MCDPEIFYISEIVISNLCLLFHLVIKVIDIKSSSILILLIHRKEWKISICSNMDGLIEYNTKWVSQKEKDKY